MKTGIFTNITNKPFTGYWDGKSKTFQAGVSKLLPLYLAEHYAKHLTNSILIEKGDITSTSPKKPEEVPLFQELFIQICKPQDDDEDEDLPEMPARKVSSELEVTKRTETTVNAKEAQLVTPVDGDDDEDEFEGLDNKSEPSNEEE